MFKYKYLASLVFLSSLSIWMLGLFSPPGLKESLGYYMQIPLALIPLIGGARGLTLVRRWGGIKSKMGKSILFLSLGMLTWSGGMWVWNYYIFIGGNDVPYPSWADAIFIFSWPLWSLGVWHLSKVIGVGYSLRVKSGKLQFASIAALMSAISYYLLFVVARGGVIDPSVGLVTLFFDLFYPIGTACIITFVLVAFILSRQYLGGRFKYPTLLLFTGFIINFFADFIFSYTTTKGVYYNGHYVDLLFALSMYVLGYAITSFTPSLEE